ncbi:MAG: 3-methyl-2-oxobutanoate dehydrogenase [Planctomycetes bacterium]|nr:3-methyl-2-oxobutanoate dehydrogenase [Planctomycetota bacterium]
MTILNLPPAAEPNSRGVVHLRVLSEKGEPLPGAVLPDLSPEKWLSIYRGMVLTRVLDGKMLILQRQGRIGFVGTATGLEAAVIASGAAFEPQDWIFPALREGGVAVYRGMPLVEYVGQMFLNCHDTSKGRQMNNHFQHRGSHFVSWSSCIGTQLPQAVGAAYAAQIRSQGTVMCGYLGDGATSSPEFHAAATFAGVWKAPVVFVCIDNGWAISVPSSAQSASRSFGSKAEAYGFPGVDVDGNDAAAVYRETRAAVDRARAGGGPSLVALKSYRILGHSSSDDPTRYRDPSEVEAWKAADPIDRLGAFLERKGWLHADAAMRLRESLEAEVDRAIDEAAAAPKLPLRALVDDVYARVTPRLVAQHDELVRVLDRFGDPTAAEGRFPL